MLVLVVYLCPSSVRVVATSFNIKYYVISRFKQYSLINLSVYFCQNYRSCGNLTFIFLNLILKQDRQGTSKLDVQRSVRRKYIPIRIQQDIRLHSLFISGNCSTCFGWFLHPSSGVQTTVSTASGTCQTVTATCRYRGGDGTGVQTPPR